MANLSFEQILKDIKNKVYYPVYFLSGEEPFFVDVISNYLEDQVLTDMEKEFNLSILYGKDTDIPNLLSVAKRFPMMASHHLVIVREAQNLRNLEPRENLKTLNPENEALVKYLEKPLESTILVFCYKYKTLDRRRKVAKTILQKGLLFEGKRVYDNHLPPWISNYVKRRGYLIGDKATQMLADHLGNDLAKVTNEIQKLFISLPKGSEITPASIEENIGISKDFNIFELQEALGEMNKTKAFRIVKYFGDNQKSNPLVLTLSMLYLFFQKIMLYHYSRDKSERGLASAIGVTPFRMKGYHKAAKNYPPERLERIFSYLRDCDLKSKGVGSRSAEPGELLKELTFKIMN
ncbi:MAG: DNA polymerase III subunit delta [Bacteroidales bacterium]|jgi:DNA polymerase-3 subunit delta|nr:DNA polymerase III subunit delta [Bacteroidales bacterium]NLM92889.1 DNA polymerase III subunit delta [Bacteroidales bacterium]